MEKISINNLIVEVTRRCTLKCAHCLRGDAQDLDMQIAYIDKLLEQVEYISTVTFTGGEPSLNTPIISYFLTQLELKDIGLGSFYIATNGVAIHTDFVITCLKLNSYCDEKEMCRVDVSNDYFHQIEESYNTELLDGLSFFGRKYQEEGHTYEGINEGRYVDNFYDGRENKQYLVETQEDFQDTEIYLNCRGNIVAGCDWSYESQENNTICTVGNIAKFYHNLPED